MMSPAPLCCASLRHVQPVHKVPSMIFDLEVEDGSKSSDANADSATDPCHITERVASLMRPRTVAEFRLRADIEALIKAGHPDTSQLATALGSLGYMCVIRTGLGGDRGVECVKNLRHAFLICTPAGTLARQGNHFLVDPEFRDNFLIANPTPRYSSLLAAVPSVFVGSQECLASVVSLLCFEMRVAFAATGATLPPWRHASSMLSKWQPRRSTDVRMSEDGEVVPVTSSGWAPPLPPPRPATSGFAAGWQSPMLQAITAAGWGSPFEGAAMESQRAASRSVGEEFDAPPLPSPAAKASQEGGAFGAKVWTDTAVGCSRATTAPSAEATAEWLTWVSPKPVEPSAASKSDVSWSDRPRLMSPRGSSSRLRSSLSLQLNAMRDFINIGASSPVTPMVS